MTTPYWQTEEFRAAHGQGAGFGRADVVAAVQAGATLDQIATFLDRPDSGVNTGANAIVKDMVADARSGVIRQDWGKFAAGASDASVAQQKSLIGQADISIYKAMGLSDTQIQAHVDAEQAAGNPTYAVQNMAGVSGSIGTQIKQGAQTELTNQNMLDQIAAINASTAAANQRADRELEQMQRLHDERLELLREQELAAVERAKQVKIRGDTQVGHRTSALGIRQRQSPFARQAARGSLQLARSHKGNQAVTGLNV